MSTVSIGMRELLEAGVHFGHQTRRWHPNMKPFLYGDRNGIHIINLQYSLPRLRAACDFVREIVANGGSLLFVGTKRQAQDIIGEQALEAGMPFVNRRWLGGMMTNFRTVRRSVERYKELTQILGDEENAAGLSKKERSRLSREHLKLHTAFEGIKDMERLPDAIFVIDIRKEAIAIHEAQRLGIPIVGIVDSNCDPLPIDHPIPGNDDAVRAIQLYCAKLGEACRLGKAQFSERIQEEGRARAEERESHKAPRGKRVVEITQPARRPARLDRMLTKDEVEGAPDAGEPASEAVDSAPAEPEKKPADASSER